MFGVMPHVIFRGDRAIYELRGPPGAVRSHMETNSELCFSNRGANVFGIFLVCMDDLPLPNFDTVSGRFPGQIRLDGTPFMASRETLLSLCGPILSTLDVVMQLWTTGSNAAPVSISLHILSLTDSLCPLSPFQTFVLPWLSEPHSHGSHA